MGCILGVAGGFGDWARVAGPRQVEMSVGGGRSDATDWMAMIDSLFWDRRREALKPRAAGSDGIKGLTARGSALFCGNASAQGIAVPACCRIWLRDGWLFGSEIGILDPAAGSGTVSSLKVGKTAELKGSGSHPGWRARY